MDESGQNHEARVLYEQSLAFRVAIYGEYHSSVATSLNSLALCLKKLGKFSFIELIYLLPLYLF